MGFGGEAPNEFLEATEHLFMPMNQPDDDPSAAFPNASESAHLTSALLAFYDTHGRNLPWRHTRDPYRIWLSEIMLQQTGVTTVIPYYHRFLAHFETLPKLAAAELEEVLALWQGLGYYRRARMLHKAARQVLDDHGGAFPDTHQAILALPGIGPSTAAAILAIAYNGPDASLDGNVKRVLARLMALEAPLNAKIERTMLWPLAERLTSSERPGDYAQAIMDLGATLCTLRNPECPACPWRKHCRALAGGDACRYPLRSPKKGAKPRRQRMVLLARRRDGALLLGRRPPEGLLGGLWEPPGADLEAAAPNLAQLRRHLRRQHTLKSPQRPQPLNAVQHTFTHFHLTVHPYLWDGAEASPGLIPGPFETLNWFDPPSLETLPLSTLYRKVLARL